MVEKKFYLTTAIPYVNAKPHIGFALELVQADAVARFRRQSGDDVFFLTGADENSLKNVLAAEAAGMTTAEFVNRNTGEFTKLCAALSITNDDFIRTVSEKHFSGAQKLWAACKPEDIYKKKYTGLYCVGCEQFYTEKELVDGKCPEHQTKPEVVEEENYFFRLSNYQDRLEKLIASDAYRVVPETRKNEVLSFIRMGLQDFSISRSQRRARGWGVPVPGDEEQVMYVWFDALSNYVTGLDYASDGPRFQRYWPADVHVIGKGIIRFHAVYWPAMLLSAGVPVPKGLFVHGYINIDGAKMSKSLGTTIDPFALVAKYGVEPVRYYLLRYIHPVQDSDFSYEKLEAAYAADLANGLGNLVSRVSGLIEQNGGIIKAAATKPDSKLERLMGQFLFDQALSHIWTKVSAIDGLISERKPWELAKAGKAEEVAEILSQAASGVVQIANDLVPFMPETAAKITALFTQQPIRKAEPLFPRLN